jgi:putative hydrolase of the HAD superfamily
MKLQAVLFDLDDTLLWDERSVKEAFEATCRVASERKGVDPERLESAVREEARSLYESYETFPFTKMIGINPFEGLWARFSGGDHPMFRKLQELAPGYRTASWTRGLQRLGVDDPALGRELGELFPQERRARPYVYDATFRVLRELRAHYKLLLLTNGAPDLQQEKLAGVPELAGFFDHIVISGNFGEGKPAASIFRHALDLLGIRPEQGIMIGDKLTTDILGSNTVGMPNIWIDHHGAQGNDSIVPKHRVTKLEDVLPIIAGLNS